jgi:pSer/pThr/pTyr-binding forkhead associated (FHA) protein
MVPEGRHAPARRASPSCPGLSAVKIRLICQDSLAFPREILVERFPVELGRGQQVAVRIDDRWLSRRHCQLDLDGGGVPIVRDLSSRHGTFINGERIAEHKLLPGDELCIGLSHFVAEYEPESAVSLVAAGR